jgi:type IV secretory pathway VirB10-like protein
MVDCIAPPSFRCTVWGAVLVNGVLKGGAMAMTREVASLGAPGTVAASVAQNASQVGPQRTLRPMNTSPTIRIPLGYRMPLILGKDVWLTPLSR